VLSRMILFADAASGIIACDSDIFSAWRAHWNFHLSANRTKREKARADNSPWLCRFVSAGVLNLLKLKY
jgi:hypothetical protein